MTRSATVRLLMSLVFTMLLGRAAPAAAADSPIGTWVKKTEPGKPAMTLTIEAWGAGKGKLTWNIKEPAMALTILAAMDGSEAPLLINGKPSGETMAIKLVDKLHANTVVKMGGKPFGTSKATFSPDFKTMTVENEFSSSVGGNPAGKATEIWTRK
jgi:hypothetical protein